MRWAIYAPLLVGVAAACSGPAPSVMPDSQNRVVDIVNTTDVPVHFYAVNAERRAANRARFGENDMAAHSYLTINFDDESGACLFDMHAAFPSGRAQEAKRFDACNAVSWVITQEGLDE